MTRFTMRLAALAVVAAAITMTQAKESSTLTSSSSTSSTSTSTSTSSASALVRPDDSSTSSGSTSSSTSSTTSASSSTTSATSLTSTSTSTASSSTSTSTSTASSSTSDATSSSSTSVSSSSSTSTPSSSTTESTSSESSSSSTSASSTTSGTSTSSSSSSTASSSTQAPGTESSTTSSSSTSSTSTAEPATDAAGKTTGIIDANIDTAFAVANTDGFKKSYDDQLKQSASLKAVAASIESMTTTAVKHGTAVDRGRRQAYVVRTKLSTVIVFSASADTAAVTSAVSATNAAKIAIEYKGKSYSAQFTGVATKTNAETTADPKEANTVAADSSSDGDTTDTKAIWIGVICGIIVLVIGGVAVILKISRPPSESFVHYDSSITSSENNKAAELLANF